MPKGAKNQQSKAVISAIAAQLFVSDITVSCEFFIQRLGFSVAFGYGKPPFYAQVKRDQGVLSLKYVDYSVIDPQLRDRESLPSGDLVVDTQ